MSATDRANNLGSEPLTVLHDTTPPVVTMTVPAQAPIRFSVAWEGLDDLSGVREYDVRYKEGPLGQWQAWLTDTLKTEAPFIGTPEAQYYFQVQAIDNVNNVSDWVEVGPVTVKGVTKYYAHGGTRVAMNRGGEVYYLHGDHLGSTSLTTDENGEVVSEVRYHPYGQERWANGEAVTDFGFTSQRLERGFGLIDYQARFYSPTLGRFISPDTIIPDPTSSAGFNRYRYTRNNPLKYTDPSGHFGIIAGAIIGGALIGGLAGAGITAGLDFLENRAEGQGIFEAIGNVDGGEVVEKAVQGAITGAAIGAAPVLGVAGAVGVAALGGLGHIAGGQVASVAHGVWDEGADAIRNGTGFSGGDVMQTAYQEGLADPGRIAVDGITGAVVAGGVYGVGQTLRPLVNSTGPATHAQINLMPKTNLYPNGGITLSTLEAYPGVALSSELAGASGAVPISDAIIREVVKTTNHVSREVIKPALNDAVDDIRP